MVKLPVSYSNCPHLPAHPADPEWDGLSRRLWIQVDCKGVADVCNGAAILKAPHLEAIFRRIVQKLFDVSMSGWRPKRDIDPILIWSPREYNTPADHLVNAAMDTGTDWSWINQGVLRAAKVGTVRLCVDGGLRKRHHGEHRGGLGCAAFLRFPNGSYEPFFLAGTVMHGATSAFHTEASALEWALTQSSL